MKFYLAYYQDRIDNYQYSLHRTERAAEAKAQIMLMEDLGLAADTVTDDGQLIGGLNLDALNDWLYDVNRHDVGVLVLTLKD